MTKSRHETDGLDAAVRIGKALDHPLRVRALAVLRDRELCVCELTELFGLAPSTVSKHMAVIADAGLAERRRRGKWTYYSLPGNPGPAAARALALVESSVEGDPVVRDDRSRVPRIHCPTEE